MLESLSLGSVEVRNRPEAEPLLTLPLSYTIAYWPTGCVFLDKRNSYSFERILTVARVMRLFVHGTQLSAGIILEAMDVTELKRCANN